MSTLLIILALLAGLIGIAAIFFRGEGRVTHTAPNPLIAWTVVALIGFAIYVLATTTNPEILAVFGQ